jgi:hypothetical protein
MSNGETLYFGAEYFRPFPDPDDVFANRVEEHYEYLLPLATLDLSHLSPEWSGDIHFVLPIEPLDGCVGDNTERYHNYLCRKNWVGYHMENGKCELACDFRFFQRAYYAAHPPTTRLGIRIRDEIPQHYERVKAAFALRGAHYRKYGCLHNCWARQDASGQYDDSDRVGLVHDLGGFSFYGNWAAGTDFPIAFRPHPQVDDDDEVAIPQTSDGRDFVFIGGIATYEFMAENAEYFSVMGGSMLLFYDPREQVALTTFDYS